MSELRLVEVLPLIVAHAELSRRGWDGVAPRCTAVRIGPNRLWVSHGSLSPRYRRAQLRQDRDRLAFLLEPVGSVRLNGMHCPRGRAVLR
jgi:hypothetical protein